MDSSIFPHRLGRRLVLALLLVSSVWLVHASPASATLYAFKIQGAGRVHDHLATKKVDFSVGHVGTSNSSKTSAHWSDLPGLWDFDMTAIAAPGWEFAGWQGEEWLEACRGSACQVHRLRCWDADEAAWLPTGRHRDDLCEFTVDVAAWNGLTAVFKDVRDPESEWRDGGPADGVRTGPEGSVRWFFAEPENVKEGSSFRCQVDSNASVGCVSGATWSNTIYDTDPQPDADVHTLKVWAVDPSGRTDKSPIQRTWVVDRQPPESFIDGGPGSPTRSTSAVFQFHATHEAGDAGGSFACRLDGVPVTPCSSGMSVTAGHGAHTFTVAAGDQFGNVDATPAAYSWTVDVQGPPATIASGPAHGSTSASNRATFEFSSAESGATFRCSVDGAPAGTCSGPGNSHRLNALSNTSHTFRVFAVDSLGNEGPAQTRTWTVHAVAPQTTVLGGPADGSVTAETSAAFTFAADKPDSTFECRVDGGSFGSCSGPGAGHRVEGLRSGEHTFDVRATDGEGNTDTSPARRVWTVDAAAPDTALTGGPREGEATYAREAFFALASEAGATFQCSLDGAAWRACSGPDASHAARGLGDGEHTFLARALDAVGNADPTPASRRWTVVRPDLSLAGLQLQGTWRRSALRAGAQLRISGTLVAPGPVQLAVTLQNRLVPSATATLSATVAPGQFAAAVPLPATALSGRALLVPGTYDVKVAATAAGQTLAATGSTRLTSPAEGVILAASISAKPRKVSAAFTFAPEARPSKAIKAIWFDPSGRRVGAFEVKAPKATTFFRWLNNRRLARGVWRCEIKMGKTTVQAVSIRLS